MKKKTITMHRLDATPQQAHFAKLVGEQGYNDSQAAEVAYPNAKDPTHAAAQARRSPVVNKLIVQYQLKHLKMEASGLSYAFLTKVVKDEIYYNGKAPDGEKIRIHEHCKINERTKAAIALHDKFGFGRVKAKDGEDPFDSGNLTDAELAELIERTQEEIKELESGGGSENVIPEDVESDDEPESDPEEKEKLPLD